MSNTSSELVKLSYADIRGIRASFPGLPEDYLNFLQDRGWGKVTNSLMLYSGPVTPEEIYGDDYQENYDSIVIFGDDFSGHCFGWDSANGYVIVEIDPVDMSYEEINASFLQFISSSIE